MGALKNLFATKTAKTGLGAVATGVYLIATGDRGIGLLFVFQGLIGIFERLAMSKIEARLKEKDAG